MKKHSIKKGMSLVELLVAITILSLGMVAFTLLSARAWNYKGYVLEQATATASASRVITQLVHELRAIRQGDDGSYPIKETEEYSMIVYRDEDGDGSAERVHYFVDNEEKLKKGVTKFVDGSYAADDATVEVLLNYVTNLTTSKPFFSYYDNRFSILTEDAMSSPTAYDTRLVRLHLWINIRPIVAPENVNLESVVELRNLNES